MYARLLPVSGAIPKPGEDLPGAAWQQHMRGGEVAVFCFDEKTGQLLTSKGELPRLPLHEYCMVFHGVRSARRVARGMAAKKPQMVGSLYDRRGRWLATMSRKGEDRRNPGLGLWFLLFQFVLTGLLGTLVIMAAWVQSARYFGTDSLRWGERSPQEQVSIVLWGFILAGIGWFLFVWGEGLWVRWYAGPVLQPVGSPKRQKFYERLAKRKAGSFLVPLEITLQPAEIIWPSIEKYEEWTRVLRQERFQKLGQYLIPETKTSLELWFHDEQDLTAAIVQLPTIGMWMSVLTRYQDGSSFQCANKNETPLDKHPTKKVVYLGTDATAEVVIQRARDERPSGPRRRPTPENLLEDFKDGWRDYVQWRRSRGTTVEEYRRVDERRARAQGDVSPWL